MMIFKQRISLLFLSTFTLLIGCSSETKEQGNEGNECYPNSTCNEGLICQNGLCVNDGIDFADCFACGNTSCATEAQACESNDGCEEALKCWLNCSTDTTCVANCDVSAIDADGTQQLQAYSTCLATSCIERCTAATGGPGDSDDGPSTISLEVINYTEDDYYEDVYVELTLTNIGETTPLDASWCNFFIDATGGGSYVNCANPGGSNPDSGNQLCDGIVVKGGSITCDANFPLDEVGTITDSAKLMYMDDSGRTAVADF